MIKKRIKRVIVKGVFKNYFIGYKKNQTAISRIYSFIFQREKKKKKVVLKDINLSLSSGELLGIIGKNGSGKSTLLKIISQIIYPDKGKVIINGKVISLISLSIGLKDRLTTTENIYLCCSIFGVSKKRTKKIINPILRFAELYEYKDTKIYQFSRGMLERLVFSIAIHCDPDILLLDEIFEIGDPDFRKKSVKTLKKMLANGVSIILVSHDLDLVKKHCSRVMKINDGKISNVKIG